MHPRFGIFLATLVIPRLAVAEPSSTPPPTESALRSAKPFAHPEEADERTPRLWRSSWPTFSWIEGAATLAGGVATMVLWSQPPPSDPRWQGGILFDDAARDSFRLDSASARKSVRAWGDLPYYAAPVLPLLVDPLVAWGVHGDARASRNVAFMGLEAFSYTGLLSFVSTRVSVRERPDSAECRRHPPESGSCEPDTEAFWSGHTSIAAASAGLTCAHHRYLPLYGHPIADGAACAVSTGGALFTGVTRLAADRHYTSDVIVGFGIGFAVGYTVPVLLHYTRQKNDVALAIVPGEGVRVSGTF